jgi:hypothetical protein
MARLGENSLQQVCESLLCLRQMARRGGDETQPLPSRRQGYHTSSDRCKIEGNNGGGVRNVRVNDQIPFNKDGNKNPQ